MYKFQYMLVLLQCNRCAPKLTCGLNLKLKVALVLMERSVCQAGSCATYSSATFYNNDICAWNTRHIHKGRKYT